MASPNDGPDRTEGLTPEVAHALVHRVYAAGLTLAACARLAGDPLAGRLAAVMHELDLVVAGVRAVVVEEVPSSPPASGGERSGVPLASAADPPAVRLATEADRDGRVRRRTLGALAEVHATLVQVWSDLVADPGTDPLVLERLLNATRCVQQAKVVLFPDTLR